LATERGGFYSREITTKKGGGGRRKQEESACEQNVFRSQETEKNAMVQPRDETANSVVGGGGGGGGVGGWMKPRLRHRKKIYKSGGRINFRKKLQAMHLKYREAEREVIKNKWGTCRAIVRKWPT